MPYVAANRVLFFFVLTILSWTSLHGQITSTNSERPSVIGARAAALADSYVAEQSDAGAMYWNPACLTFIRQPSVVLNYALERVSENDNTMTENVVMPIPSESDWKVGLGLTFFHIGKIKDVGSPIAGMNFRQYGFDIGLARKLSHALSIGILVNTKYGKVSSTSLGTVASSVGAFYSPLPGISYGLVLQGVGWGIEYHMVGGTTVPSRAMLDRSIQMGLSVNIPSRLDRQMLTLTLTNQKILGADGLVYKGGVEVIPVRFLMIRAGYWVGPESAAAKFGAGIRVGQVRIDYAASFSESEPRFHQVSFTYVFNDDVNQR